MGLFNRGLTEEAPVVMSFQMIAVAIDVSAYTNIESTIDIQIADLWALYFWVLAPLENGKSKLPPELYKVLKWTPGNPMNPNLTNSHETPSNASFVIHPDHYQMHIETVSELTGTLRDVYLNVPVVNDSNFMSEFASVAIQILNRTMPERVSRSTQGVLAMGALALRSALKESNSLSAADKSKVRSAIIFWISMMLATWHFKN